MFLLFIFTAWRVLAIVAIVGLIIFYKKKIAWGTFLAGIFIGFVIAVINLIKQGTFQTGYIKMAAVIGALAGIMLAIITRLFNQSKRENLQAP